MKKIIALLLSLIIIFSFTGCEKLSAQGQRVSAVLTGMGKKTIKLTLKGDILDGTVKTVGVPTDKGGGTFAKSDIAKDKGKTVVIKFTGLEAGAGEIVVQCSKGEELVCLVRFMLSVSADMTLDCGNLSVSDGEFLDFETSGDNKEEAAANVKIPVMDEDSNLIYLRKLDGEWIEEDFDDEIVNPKLIADEDEEFVKYQVLPVSEGEATVTFINITAMKKVVANYVVEDVGPGQTAQRVYNTNIKDFIYTDYSMEEYLERRGQALSVEKIKIFDPDFNVSGDWIINGFAFYNDKTMKEFTFDEGASLDTIVLPEDINTVSVDLKNQDHTIELIISSGKTLEDTCKEIDFLKATESVKDMQMGPNGVYNIKYYRTTYGFGVAVWENGNYTYKITFSGDSTEELDVEILNKYLL